MTTRNLFFGTTAQGKISYNTNTGNFTLGNSNDDLLHINSNKNIGVGFKTSETPTYKLDVSGGAINTDTYYNINGTKVLDATSLGSGVVNSSLTSVGILDGVTISGSATINGDLIVNGTVTEIDTENITVEDSLIQLAKNNLYDLTDIGLFGSYKKDEEDIYTGFYRDSTDGIYKFFTGLKEKPVTTVNNSGIGYTDATILVGDMKTSTINATGNILSNSLDVTTNLSIGGTLDVTNNTSIGGTLDVIGDTTLSTVSTTGTANLNSAIVTNNTSIGGTFNVIGDTTLSTVSTTSSVNVGGGVNVTTDYKIGTTSVLNSTTLGNDVVNSSLQNLGIQNTDLNMGNNNITNVLSVSATNVSGTLQTAEQSNITSVGTLMGLNVNGTTNLTTTNTYQINNNTVLSETTLGSGIINSSLQNLGIQNTDLNMGNNNITNAISVSATNVSATNVSGILQTATQPNITSVGNLTTLNVLGSLVADTDTFFVDSITNNIGIGTLKPDSKLHIIDDTDNQADETGIHGLKISTGQNGQTLMIGYDGDDNLSYINSGDTNGTTNLVLQSRNGNVGIGVTNPTHELEVSGDINFTGNLYRNGFLFTSGSGGNSINDGDNTTSITTQETVETIIMKTNSLERMRINSSGNVGIGTTTPIYKLEVNGDVKFTGNELNIEAQGTSDAYTRYQINGVARSWATGIDNSDSDKFKINTLNTNIVGPSTGTNVMTMLTSGEVGIGTETPLQPLHIQGNAYVNNRIGIRQSTPSCPLHIKQEEDDNGNNLSSYNQAGLIIERNANTNKWSMSQNTYNDLAFSYNLIARGYISSNGTNNQFNFTGQHRTQMEVNNTETLTNINDYVGLIVISTGNYIQQTEGTYIINGIDINEALPKLELSTVSNDKKCFGIISNGEDLNENNRTYSIGNFVSVFNKEQGDNRVIVNSLGEGGIWVCEENGAFENGDYITTSNLSGYGMKQNDDLLHNYTVAKITCNEDFGDMTNGRTINGVKCKFVGCVYVCG